jgi:putative serine protease PepD
VAAIYERARPGVVDVQVRTGGGTATGSGFVVDDDGTIVTNEHVVDQARTARIRFAGQDEPVTARVLGADASSDLAVLRVDPDDVKGDLRPLPLGSSGKLRVGEPAIALGSPFGLDGTLTTGVVSALERDIRAPNGFTIDEVVQTDAAINPGNSGGPLLDGDGRVIGVNSQRAGGEGSALGFAVPVDTLKQVLPRLKRGEDIRRPFLGVSTTETDAGSGARVAAVVPGGPAADAGLRAGDVITRVGDTRVAEASDVAGAIESLRPGEEVTITYTRNGDERTGRVKLGTRPEEITR